MSRSSRIGETENRLRDALVRGDADRALGAARQLRKFQARENLALGTAIRLAVVLHQGRHPLAPRAIQRCIERAQSELAGRQLAVIAEADLDGLGEQPLADTCTQVLAVLARDHEWTPVPAS